MVSDSFQKFLLNLSSARFILGFRDTVRLQVEVNHLLVL